MKGRWNLTGTGAGICFLLLILDSPVALEGARQGLELCIRTVIPSLFPFLAISMVLTRNINPGASLLRRAASLLKIPEPAAPVLIPAFLGGYPVGAKCVHDLYREGILDRHHAQRLLTFCSNAGPAFLFGMVGGFFSNRETIWLLWLILIASAVLTALCFPPPEERKAPVSGKKAAEGNILPSAMEAMGLICCWVILFRILTVFLTRWCLWLLPDWLQVLMTGVLELTNGCCELAKIGNEKLRFLVCGCMLSWGGICVLMQTVSVTEGLSIGSYLLGKLLQTLFTLLLSLSFLFRQLWIVSIVAVIPLIIRKVQKGSGKLAPFPV